MWRTTGKAAIRPAGLLAKPADGQHGAGVRSAGLLDAEAEGLDAAQSTPTSLPDRTRASPDIDNLSKAVLDAMSDWWSERRRGGYCLRRRNGTRP
jgi:hypothetical protein